jgi:hypothetical protein
VFLFFLLFSVAGIIPYPEKFNLDIIQRTMQTYLIQISEYEKKRKILESIDDQKKKDARKDAAQIPKNNEKILSPPPAYLFHLVDVQHPNSFDMGHQLLQKLGNFPQSFVSKDMFRQTAQFYYGRHGSGAPFHFHGNALNVLLTGSKQWLLTDPAHAMYSRIHPQLWSSTMEQLRHKKTKSGSKRFYKCTQPENSLMFVPKGWSHAVLNDGVDVPTVGVAVEFTMTGATGDLHQRLTQQIQSKTDFANGLEYRDIVLF